MLQDLKKFRDKSSLKVEQLPISPQTRTKVVFIRVEGLNHECLITTEVWKDEHYLECEKYAWP